MSLDKSHKSLGAKPPSHWLALVIGNSQLHWAKISDRSIVETWNIDHGAPLPDALSDSLTQAPLLFASVVPQQTQWVYQQVPSAHQVTLQDLPLCGLYPTLGVDRALALLGAGYLYGWPALVIDGGTALTLTGADAVGNLVGGAILPGIQLQLGSLEQGTAALPQLQAESLLQPSRWARSTGEAIASGVLYGVTAALRDYIQDWEARFPGGQVVLTGGAAQRLQSYLVSLPVAANLAFLGLAVVRAGLQERSS